MPVHGRETDLLLQLLASVDLSIAHRRPSAVYRIPYTAHLPHPKLGHAVPRYVTLCHPPDGTHPGLKNHGRLPSYFAPGT